MMKTFLLSLSIVWVLLLSVQGTEGDSFDAHFYNTTWPEKKRLSIIVKYVKDRSQTQEEDADFTESELILEGVTRSIPLTKKSIQLPKRGIQSIELYLTNYHENPSPEDLSETFIASLNFRPKQPLLLGVSFTIQGSAILANPAYLPPPLVPTDSQSPEYWDPKQ